MSLFTVDKNKCQRCGACAAVCPSRLIAAHPADGPYKSSPRSCIACGHCVAVCPTAALDNRKAPLAGQMSLDGWQPPGTEEMTKILRYRRSIRTYREDAVSADKLRALLEVARHAPSGVNSQSLSFTVISGRDKLNKIGNATVAWLEEEEASGAYPPGAFAGVIENCRQKGEDIILRGAPNLIVAFAPEWHPYPNENCAFVWAYAELFAPSLGLGTCIAGYVQMCASAKYKPLLELLAPPSGLVTAGALMAGYPRYRYRRLPARQELRIIE